MRHYMTGCGERRVGFKNQVHECIRWLGLGTGVRVVGVEQCGRTSACESCVGMSMGCEH